MVSDMRLNAVVVVGFLAVACVASAQVEHVHSIYLLPMSGSLDQYLAHRLTSSGAFEVVTDPAKADAIMTDQLGEDFEKKLAEIYPEAVPAKPETPAAKPDSAAKKEGAKAKEQKEDEPLSASDIKEPPMVRFGGARKGKGMVFLVDGRNRKVLWSAYEQPRRTAPAEMERTAGRIVDQLTRALKKK